MMTISPGLTSCNYLYHNQYPLMALLNFFWLGGGYMFS